MKVYLKREVPEGHAYVTTNGGWMPSTGFILWLPDGRHLSSDAEDSEDPLKTAKTWLAANAPGVELYPHVVATL